MAEVFRSIVGTDAFVSVCSNTRSFPSFPHIIHIFSLLLAGSFLGVPAHLNPKKSSTSNNMICLLQDFRNGWNLPIQELSVPNLKGDR
jgi:hypothetical protein